jgi:trimeric autotransporter adhesin
MTTSTNNPFNPTALANGTSTLTMRTDALNISQDLVQAGVAFNDATRLLDGGLWDTVPTTPNSGGDNQAPYLGLYTTDLHGVLADLTQDLANPGAVTVGGAAYTLTSADTAVLNEVVPQLQALINEAPNSIGNATVEGQIQATQESILNEINGDPTLHAALANITFMSGTGATDVGFQALPTVDQNAADASTPGATLEQIGQVFNAASELAIGGINSCNEAQINTDLQAVATGIQNILNNPTQLAAIEANDAGSGITPALTTVHLDTILNEVNLQVNDFDQKSLTSPDIGARGANDNFLDIVDIVNNDPALNVAAGGTNTTVAGVTTPGLNAIGFGEFPAYLNANGGAGANGGTIEEYQDNQTQTNFWTALIAEANNINTDLNTVATGGTPSTGSIQSLINEIEQYQQFGSNFDIAQGGVFGARFDNELIAGGGTLSADTSNAVAGLQSILANGNNAAADAQIIAAGQGFVDDAHDVSGNNVPFGGGSYTDVTPSGVPTTTPQESTTPTGVGQGSVANGVTITEGSGAGTGTGLNELGPVPPASGNYTYSDGQNYTTTPAIPNGNGLTTGTGTGTAGTAAATGTDSGATTPYETTGSGETTGGSSTVASTTTPAGTCSAGHAPTEGTAAGDGTPGGEGTTTAGTGEGAMTPTIAGDIAALIQALEGGNGTAINSAVAALATAVNGGNGSAAGSASAAGGDAGAAASGAGSSFAAGGEGSAAGGAGNHHFEHMWHF